MPSFTIFFTSFASFLRIIIVTMNAFVLFLFWIIPNDGSSSEDDSSSSSDGIDVITDPEDERRSRSRSPGPSLACSSRASLSLSANPVTDGSGTLARPSDWTCCPGLSPFYRIRSSQSEEISSTQLLAEVTPRLVQDAAQRQCHPMDIVPALTQLPSADHTGTLTFISLYVLLFTYGRDFGDNLPGPEHLTIVLRLLG